ncbi:hypothetical protein CBL_07133 [Carabus blaptoides fortunei]
MAQRKDLLIASEKDWKKLQLHKVSTVNVAYRMSGEISQLMSSPVNPFLATGLINYAAPLSSSSREGSTRIRFSVVEASKQETFKYIRTQAYLSRHFSSEYGSRRRKKSTSSSSSWALECETKLARFGGTFVASNIENSTLRALSGGNSFHSHTHKYGVSEQTYERFLDGKWLFRESIRCGIEDEVDRISILLSTPTLELHYMEYSLERERLQWINSILYFTGHSAADVLQCREKEGNAFSTTDTVPAKL